MRSSVEESSSSIAASSTFTFRPLSSNSFANNFSFTSNGNSVSASEDESDSRQIFFGLPLSQFCRSSNLSLIGLQRYQIDLSYRHILLYICRNDRVTHEIVAFVIAKIPEAARAVTPSGATPLHLVCESANATQDIARSLIEAHPNAPMEQDSDGFTPLHVLCKNRALDEDEKMEILKLFIQRSPESLHLKTLNDALPIHYAIKQRSSQEFCILLVHAFPESILIPWSIRYPNEVSFKVSVLSMICTSNDVDDSVALALMEMIIENYPEKIRRYLHFRLEKWLVATIHFTSRSTEMCSLLVQNLPGLVRKVVEVKGNPFTLLMLACQYTNASNLSRGLEMINLLFDAYPEAINGAISLAEAVRLTENRFLPAVDDFLAAQGQYVELASNIQRITTLDDNGYLPLHIALHEGARLGAIKLLIQAAPSTLLTPSINGNIALHEACRLRNYDVIDLLVIEYPTAQVYARNTLGELPLQVLLANGDDEQENVRYLSSIFLLLRANPPTEVPMNDMDMNLVSEFASFSLHVHDD